MGVREKNMLRERERKREILLEFRPLSPFVLCKGGYSLSTPNFQFFFHSKPLVACNTKFIWEIQVFRSLPAPQIIEICSLELAQLPICNLR